MNNMIEEYLSEDRILAEKLYRITQHIEDSIKQNGDISQFKEDVMYVIHFLLEKGDTKQLTATELQVKRMEYNINKMQKEKDEEYIGVLKSELEQKDRIMDKMAEKLVEDTEWFYSEFDNYTKQDFIEYFKKEVEKR